MKSIHVWVSGIHETGGIQHYSSCCLLALRELFPSAKLRVFSKNDSHLDRMPSAHAFGGWSPKFRTPVFAATGLAWALAERPDFVFATHPHFMKALAPLTMLGIPCVVAAHGIEVWGQMQGRLGDAMRAATGILPVSAYTRDVIHREVGVPLSQMPVVPNTFREADFVPGGRSQVLMERYGLVADQPVIFTVGRLSASERYKGQDQVLLAMPSLIRDLPGLRYIIGGRGVDEARLRQIVSDLNLEQHVTFTGFIPEVELADHYRLADLYVMPSTGEGFGIVYLESLACGRPCLVGNEDASPEAIDHGRLGFVVAPRDPVQIAKAILSFFSRRHDKPWLHEENYLHNETTRLFGGEAFSRRLVSAITALIIEKNNSQL